MLTQKHLLLVLLHFCLTMRIPNKPPKAHVFLPPSGVCYKHCLELTGPHCAATPCSTDICQNPVNHQKKKSNRRSKQVVKLSSALHPFPLQAPKSHLSPQLPWPAVPPFKPTGGKPGYLESRSRSGKLWQNRPGRDGSPGRHSGLAAFPAFTFFKRFVRKHPHSTSQVLLF